MTLLSLLPLATAVAPAPALAVSAHPPRPTVHASASAPRGYAYHGCFNETTGLPGTAGQRALYGGASLVRPGDMTVGACWAFCAGGGGEGGEGYVFAGLEYARYVVLVVVFFFFFCIGKEEGRKKTREIP